jgi:DNA/RNA-binding domain of Phe-tRNA-synthetase-like protein
MEIYRIDREIFARLPEACFGVVIARGVMQPAVGSAAAEVIAQRLAEAVEIARSRFAGAGVKTHPDIVPYREAFQRLGINPNRFPSSIEAMAARIAKGGAFPSINPAVDLANTAGLRYGVPLGVHDLDRCSGTIEVRPAREGDIFTPFGTTVPEAVEPGEVVYADGTEVRTRRWIWRQGEYSKATGASTNLFYPIDGFRGVNETRVLEARTSLASALRDLTGATVLEHWVDSDHPSIAG